MDTPLPAPRAKLAGCMWLPRILEKGRRLRAGTLPEEYAQRVGAANGTDGQFLGFFGLTLPKVLEASQLSDGEAERWFLDQPGIDAANIDAWNELAPHLGRPGFPMAERLPVAMATTYAHLKDPHLIGSVFEALEADEGIC